MNYIRNIVEALKQFSHKVLGDFLGIRCMQLDGYEPATPSSSCGICHRNEQTFPCKKGYITCMNPSKRHKICIDCFEETTIRSCEQSQTSAFIQNGYRVACADCLAECGKQYRYKRGSIRSYCTQDVFNKFEAAVATAKREAANMHMQKKDAGKKFNRDRSLSRHALHVSENILVVHDRKLGGGGFCPNKLCNAPPFSPDWTHCMCLHCPKCEVTFCGWCLFSFGFNLNPSRKTEAHNHIKTCPNSQNPGRLYTRGDGESTKAEDFQIAHAPRKKQEVLKYIQDLSPADQMNIKIILKDDLKLCRVDI